MLESPIERFLRAKAEAESAAAKFNNCAKRVLSKGTSMTPCDGATKRVVKCQFCGGSPRVSESAHQVATLCECGAKAIGPIDATFVHPQFDVMAPEQERLAVEFSAEINKAGGVDPVRLLEMAEALYHAEVRNA